MFPRIFDLALASTCATAGCQSYVLGLDAESMPIALLALSIFLLRRRGMLETDSQPPGSTS